MRRLIVFVATTVLSACSLTTYEKMAAEGDAQKQVLLANVPKCGAPRECEGMWSAARNWVTSHCEMKIQTISDSFIETYSSRDSSAACRLTKDPESGGGYSFHLAVNCDTLCVPSPVDRITDFQTTLRATGDSFKGTP